ADSVIKTILQAIHSTELIVASMQSDGRKSLSVNRGVSARIARTEPPLTGGNRKEIEWKRAFIFLRPRDTPVNRWLRSGYSARCPTKESMWVCFVPSPNLAPSRTHCWNA